MLTNNIVELSIRKHVFQNIISPTTSFQLIVQGAKEWFSELSSPDGSVENYMCRFSSSFLPIVLIFF